MTTYYLRADGTAANKAAASGPGSTQANCMNVAVHNAETFSAGDVIKVCDDGGVIRGQITPPSAGSDGSPITYEPESGDSPIVNGSELVVTWGDEGDNVWSASFAPVGGEETTVAKVFFDGTLGTEEVGGTGDLTEANEWYFDDGNDVLYVYSTSDPDTAYTTPGIEATSQDFCIHVDGKSYITIDGIDCHKGNVCCIKIEGTAHTAIIQNLVLSHSGTQSGFLSTGTQSNPYLYNVRATYCGKDSNGHGFYMASGGANGPFLMENCTADNGPGAGFQVYQGAGGTLNYCLAYNNLGPAGMMAGDLRDDSNAYFNYCISYDNQSYGFRVSNMGDSYNGNNDIVLYNCVSYSNDYYGGVGIYGNHADSSVIVKNTISIENEGWSDFGDMYVDDHSGSIVLDNNLYYRANGANVMIKYEGTEYTQSQFATYQAAKSQDANGKSADPLFTNPGSADFTRQVTSPCTDAGVYVGLDRDYAGNRVPQGAAPDIGAYEYPNVLSTLTLTGAG